jgi:asparagine synthase (glutamine-hydrolysing)
MITGAFTFSTDEYDSLLRVNNHEIFTSGGVYHRVDHGCFRGSYFIHRNLPYTPTDFYYFDKANDLVVLLSGSVYNASELQRHSKLSVQVPFPELVANLFIHEGPAFVKNLNGDFTIFIARPGLLKAYLFRDHLGIRPMAWTINQETFYFSSDITGLCKAFSDGQDIDTDYLMGCFKYIDYRKTPNSKVTKLLPGHYLRISAGGIYSKKYWEPEKISKDRTLSYNNMLAELKTILCDAVRIRCNIRFTACSHISSGLDSGVVSALARKEFVRQERFYGISWSPNYFTPGNVKYDEREIVLSSCKKLKILPLFSDMSLTDFPNIVSEFYKNKGFFSEERASDQAVEQKANLLLSGWGGDEFISTGDRGIETDLLRGLKFRLFFSRNKINHPWRFVKDFINYVIYPLIGRLNNSTSRSFSDDARYLKKPFKKSDKVALRNFYFHSSRRQLHLRMLDFYHIQDRCESWAVNGYYKGIEYRYPLLDKRIIEYMLKIPSELLCMTDHYRPLLREISKGILPKEIRLQRSKNDPVYWAYMAELFKGAALQFMEEVNTWKENQDLQFVNFDLLESDIFNFKNQPELVDEKVLFRAMIYLKAIHEFTKEYHKL